MNNYLPSTTHKRASRGSWRMYSILVLILAGLALLIWLLSIGLKFEPGEKLAAQGVRDIAVSERDTLYPSSDVLRFAERPQAVHVYVAVDGLNSGTKLSARVERSGRGSLLSRLFSGAGAALEAVDENEEQLSPSSGGVSGVAKFIVRTKSGEPVPPGDYTVIIYRSDANAEGEEEAARKLFVVRG